MKKILFILLALTIPVLLLAEEPVREWKTKTGKTIEASFDVSRNTNPETVYLLKEGKLFKVPFKNLSQADQEYVTKVRENVRNNSRSIKVVPAGNRYALLIGVNEYAKPIRSLRYCVNDMKLLADCFERIGIPKENIILITDDSPMERRPTGENIRQQIEVLTQLMEPNDQLIIAFGGHGAMVDGKSFLCPSDTNLDNKKSIISRDWAFTQLEKCKAKQKIFIIDACRDEVSFGNQRDLGSAKTLEDPIGADTHGFILIASCDKKQKSWEHSNLKHGVFTYFLAEGLAGAAKDEDDYVSIVNLFQYASKKTKKYVYREFNKAQVPTFRQGGEMTDFFLAKVDSDISLPRVEQNSHASSSFFIVQSPSLPLKPGDRLVYKGNGVEFAFRWCPPGTFMMGSPESEKDRYSDETQHEVTLTKGFWMMETEVTQKQWKAVIGINPSNYNGDELPVERVSWFDSLDFCNKCTELGMPLQLPTEAQWEYACRAGITGTFEENEDDPAWCIYNTWCFMNSGERSHPVGTKKPNAWGLHDMIGNVSEWCQDWYGAYPKSKVTDPTGPSSGSKRVLRGGSFNCGPQDCRPACRCLLYGSFDPGFRGRNSGFRPLMLTTSPDN